MSIWSTITSIGFDDDYATVPGEVLSYAAGWSNHYPTIGGEVEQPAGVHLASIAPWCVPGHDDECEPCGVMHDAPESGPWLRLSASSPSAKTYSFGGTVTPDAAYTDVLLDEQAARSLAAALLEWADSPKIKPTFL